MIEYEPGRPRVRTVRSSWDHFIIAKRERVLPRGFFSLTVGIIAALATYLLSFLAIIAAFGYDLIQFFIFGGLALVAAVIALVSMIRALVLFAMATVNSYTAGHTIQATVSSIMILVALGVLLMALHYAGFH
jgi:hypothetical protein